MKQFRSIAIGLILIGSFAAVEIAQEVSRPSLVQPTLTAPGGTPFYLQAEITERGDPNEHIEVEMSWVAPDKWRRQIRSEEFSQTLIVNGDNVFEQDSSDYFPIGIQTLVTAMVDPRPAIDAVRPGDRVMTKANGGSNESGKMCFGPNLKVCVTGRYGLMESLGGPGRTLDFMDYQKFKDKRVARILIYHIDAGDSLQAHITTLGELKSHDESRFLIANPSSKESRIRSVVLAEAELRDVALQPADIIWPQVLEDNQTTGETSYYVSVDRTGQVREVFPLSISVERADDSARRQLLKWKFKPVLRDGVPVQAEAALHFHFDTRAYGPAAPLTDVEARKLAVNAVDPVFPVGIAPSGSTFTVWIAVDVEGKIIESIAGDGARQLAQACSQAIGKWHFTPILEDGKPRPYRAQITCRVP